MMPRAPDLIRIYNRSDCCGERLNGTVVRAFSDAAATTEVFASTPVAGSPAQLNYRFPSAKSIRVVELRQSGNFLHVGEVQLFQKAPAVLPPGTNLSLASLAFLTVSQSSGTANPAGLAIDGNTGNFTGTADGQSTNQWWKVDLGEVLQIQQVGNLQPGRSFVP